MADSLLYGTYTIKADEEHDFDIILEYYLNEEDMCREYSDLKKYGVTVKKTEKYPGGVVTEETKTINGVFYRKEDVTEFLDKLIRNSVTTVGLKDILEEHICEKISVA